MASLAVLICTAGLLLILAAGTRSATPADAAAAAADQSSCYARDTTGGIITYKPCDPTCSASGNYTAGSAYDRSLRRLLAAVPTNATAGGFFNGTAGSGPEDTVFALATCQADLPPAECGRCLRSPSANLTGYCPHSRTVIAAYVGCLLRYSDKPFFGVALTGLLSYEPSRGPTSSAGTRRPSAASARRHGCVAGASSGGQPDVQWHAPAVRAGAVHAGSGRRRVLPVPRGPGHVSPGARCTPWIGGRAVDGGSVGEGVQLLCQV